MRRFFRSVPGGLWVILLVLIVSVVVIRSSVQNWVWLNGLNGQSNADTIRVIALILGGVIAVILTLWRSMIAERQAKTGQLGLRNERYQKGAEMLGSEILTVRLGGIYALRRLAEEYPQEYHVQIMRLFCAFVRFPPEIRAVLGNELSLDIDAIIEVLVLRNKSSVELEKRSSFCVDLSGAKLYRVARSDFEDIDFRGAKLTSTRMPYSHFRSGADLSGILGSEIDLSSSFLLGVDPAP